MEDKKMTIFEKVARGVQGVTVLAAFVLIIISFTRTWALSDGFTYVAFAVFYLLEGICYVKNGTPKKSILNFIIAALAILGAIVNFIG